MFQFLQFYYLCQINPNKIVELMRYFYHPDHASTGLSSSWITDNNGDAIQHLHYLPFKKLRFFSSLAFGNEKQVFHYAHCLRRFGARYYDSGLSIWLSVDPMSDKYPSMSPYNYCANNPVILVDPDGMSFDDADKVVVAQMHSEYDEKIRAYEYELSTTTDEKRKTQLNGFITEMQNAKTELTDLENSDQKYAFRTDNNIVGKVTYENNTVVITVDNILSFNLLAHELKHASQFERKELSFTKNGKEGGHLYDITDEYAAYDRQAAFEGVTYDREKTLQNRKYDVVREKTMKLSITPENQVQFKKWLNTAQDIYKK